MSDHTLTVLTRIGPIAYIESGNPAGTPILFLHGVFFDHRMWNGIVAQLQDYRCFALDMPSHGDSKGVNTNWNLNDSVHAVIDFLEKKDLKGVLLVGHSWGSMVSIRLAADNASRVGKLILFNSPIKSTSFFNGLSFRMQMMMVGFTSFYAKQAAKALMGKAYLMRHPEEVGQIVKRLQKMGPEHIRHTIREVILRADDGYPYYDALQVPKVFVTAEDDYTRRAAPKQALVWKGGGGACDAPRAARSGNSAHSTRIIVGEIKWPWCPSALNRIRV